MSKKKSPKYIAFYQALGQFTYIILVALVFWRGDKWFGPTHKYLGPVLVLTLLSVSALISAIIVFAYPFYIFWEKKKTKEALKIIIYTAVWLLVFFMLVMLFLILR